MISQSWRTYMVEIQGLWSLCLQALTLITILCSKNLCKSHRRERDPLTDSDEDFGLFQKWRVKGLSA